MGYHVTEVRLPKPGGYEAFAVVAELHAQPLDRSRPLWQFTVVGIAPGQIAVHPLAPRQVDGQAGDRPDHPRSRP
jgi:hypothetical protein